MKKSTAATLLILITLLLPTAMIILSTAGEWKDLHVYKAPEGNLSLRVQTFSPIVDFLHAERQRVYIDRGGWDYPAEFSIQYTNDKAGWMKQCAVEWKENEVIFNTPDGYSIHLSKSYNPG